MVAATLAVRLSTQEKIAAAVCAAILLATLIYWIFQIVDVVAVLRMVYGQ